MSAFALKIIAIATMLIDHCGHAFHRYMPQEMYILCKFVGRLAMPLFCFLLAEGLLKTKNVKKYLGRILGFAIISEVPFDLFLNRRPWAPEAQNVMFTLFLGLLGIMLFDLFAARNRRFPALLSILGCGLAASVLQTDYSIFGVYFIFVFYFARGNIRLLTLTFAAGVLLLAASQYFLDGNPTFALLTLMEMGALPMIFRYNGERGYTKKWFQWAFYAFYPAHLLILYVLRELL